MWYNVIVKKQNSQEHYTAYQLKLPVEIEKLIEISDPVYGFCEVMYHIDLNKYSWVWKKSCVKNRIKLFAKITELLENMNAGTALLGVKFDIREEYAIEYLEEILKKYIELVGFDPGKAVHGKGNHKTSEQRLIEKLSEYIERLKKYKGNRIVRLNEEMTRFHAEVLNNLNSIHGLHRV